MREAIGKNFERLGGTQIDPEIILPAALPLDLCGESVRARLCVFTDHMNRDLALRPDLTLPVALAEIGARKTGQVTGEQVYQYSARAFRMPMVPGEPIEFLQVGFERFGADPSAEVDAETYTLVSEAAEKAGVQRGIARFGDLGLVPAFLDQLDLSPAIGAGLRRAFREAGGLAAFLERANRPRDAFVQSLEGLDRSGIEDAVAAHMDAANISHFGNRSLDEIITRLGEQAREVGADAVSPAAQAVLEALLELDCAPSEAADKLRAIAETAGIAEPLEDTITALELRMNLIAAEAPAFLGAARFSPGFGRRFTYYDGFVFEIAEPGARADRPFGAGGRYDRLLADLSLGNVSATAIGGVVRADRIALACGKDTG